MQRIQEDIDQWLSQIPQPKFDLNQLQFVELALNSCQMEFSSPGFNPLLDFVHENSQNIQKDNLNHENTEFKLTQAEIPAKTSESGDGKKVRCRCVRSNCIKSYCQCFAAGGLCNEKCGCTGCHNMKEQIKETHNDTPKINKETSRKEVGCVCKKTKCIKNYCQCYRKGKGCGKWCKCLSCQNSKDEHKNDSDTIRKQQ